MTLYLKALGTDRKTYGGFYVPNEVGAVITAPDWDPDPETKIGGGIYAFERAVGDWHLANLALSLNADHQTAFNKDNNIRWVVLESSGNVVYVNGAARLKEAVVKFISDTAVPGVYNNNMSQYTGYIIDQELAAQNPGDPEFLGYTWDYPMMGTKFSILTETPVGEQYHDSDLEKWNLSYYDATLGDWIERRYVFAQNVFQFGANSKIKTDFLTGTSRDQPARSYTFGPFSVVDMHYSNMTIVAEDHSNVTACLGNGGLGCKVTVGDYCTVVIDKDCEFVGGSFLTLEDRGTNRQWYHDTYGDLGPDITVDYNCNLRIRAYASVRAGARARINSPTARYCTVDVGPGSYVHVGTGSVVKAGPASVIRFATSDTNLLEYIEIMVGVGDIKDDEWYTLSEDKVINNSGTIDIGEFESNIGSGSPQTFQEDTTGVNSILSNLRSENLYSVDNYSGVYDIRSYLVKK